MKRRTVQRAVCGASALLAITLGPASALASSGERVLVVARSADENGRARLAQELTLLAFDTTSVLADDAEAPCALTGIAPRAREVGAVAALCIDREAIRIWVGGETGMFPEAIPLRDATGSERTLVEVQAAEIVRASLRSASSSPVPLFLGNDLPPLDRRGGPAPAEPATGSVATEPGVEPVNGLRPGYRTARFGLSVGPGFMTSDGGPIGTAEVRATIGVARWVSLAPRLVIPLGSREVASNYSNETGAGRSIGIARARPALVGMGLSLPLLPATSTFSAEAGLAGAVVWMHVMPSGAAGELTTTRSEDLFALGAYAELSTSLRVTEHLRVGMAGALGATAGHLVVRLGGVEKMKWGTPFGDAALRATWIVP